MDNNHTIIVKVYDLSLWYVKKIERFPKNHRYSLGERVQTELFDMMAILVEAIYSPRNQKKSKVAEVNIKIEKLRLFTRLLSDLNILSTENKRYILGLLNEIGAMAGGWLKSL